MAIKVRTKSVVREYVQAAILIIIIIFVLRAYVVWNARVLTPNESGSPFPRGSMEETLYPGDFILVNKLSYHFSDPSSGDIIIFENPIDPTITEVSRIIAVEGDSIAVVGKIVYVNGTPVPEPRYAIHTDYAVLPADLDEFNRDNYGPEIVPANHVFVMGDNRDQSVDSRTWGFLDRNLITGEIVLVYWSWDYVSGGFFGRSIRWGRLLKAIK
jgi:signal peptidase I